MILLWDGIKSLIAALVALAVCGVPAAAALWALRGWPLPGWAFWPVALASVLLGLIGLVLAASFLRKSWRGVSPSRDRRR